MNAGEFTARGRALGAELRAWRERARLQSTEIARRLSWSPTKVCNLESGRRAVSEVDAAMYLACCRTPGDDIQKVLKFFHEQYDYWVQPHGQLPDELRSLITLETTATVIQSFEMAFVPGLLQTEDYARALISSDDSLPRDAMDPRVRARKARQVLLRREWPPKCVFFVQEHALRLRVGSDALMNDQLLHLVFASARPQITIRVVPAAAGPHAGMQGSFMLMAYPKAKSLVYLENEVSSLFVDGPACVGRYRQVLARLAQIALGEEESRSWLAQRAGEYDRPREDQDDDQLRAEGRPMA